MVEQRSCSNLGGLVFPCLLLLIISFSGCVEVEAYKNYTVGDSLGWYDTLLKPTVNYQKWATGKNFSLGDFLIFNTDSNHSVVQTYNFTTYKRCDSYNALENDTTEWSTTDPSSTSIQPVTVAVPLVKEGMNYFFSGDYDGEQCKFGQHMKINVTYGQGLPKSLMNPSDEAPAPANPNSGDDQSAPDTVVPANFSNPQDSSDNAVATSGSVSLSTGFLNGVLVLLGVNLYYLTG
ncbi:blue copper protein-like [Camellia sinensis]|uniref:Phytocyanin domain-containing protein n=1 Tax=Camellia sinensis var. sinensis TaxID=542762 RepID=A0A4V3WLP9_CAMSN|nr:blue copper protein-like [Camellia sinensis]THG05627.1 hypothetical protein TEA_000812 [Camellia sinensis var. sinensis]